jgi:hypothetical protein
MASSSTAAAIASSASGLVDIPTIPMLSACVDKWLPQREVQDFFFYLLRMIVSPQLMKKGTLILLYGNGNNGKSTMLERIRAALHEYNPGLELYNWSATRNLYSRENPLEGKRFTLVAEEDTLLQNSESVNRLLENGVSIIMGCNKLPLLGHLKGVASERCSVIHFPSTMEPYNPAKGLPEILSSPFWSQYLLMRIFAVRYMCQPDIVRKFTEVLKNEGHCINCPSSTPCMAVNSVTYGAGAGAGAGVPKCYPPICTVEDAEPPVAAAAPAVAAAPAAAATPSTKPTEPATAAGDTKPSVAAAPTFAPMVIQFVRNNSGNETITITPDTASNGFYVTLATSALRLYLKDIDAIETYLDLVLRCMNQNLNAKNQQAVFRVPGFPTVVLDVASARDYISEDLYEQLELLVEDEAWPVTTDGGCNSATL